MKLPYMQFFCGDWMADPALSMCSPATRGIWIDILCAMHLNDQCGKLSVTIAQLARNTRATEQEVKSAIEELTVTKASHVTVSDGIVTLINRRMFNEYNKRHGSSLRMRRMRELHACDTNVTLPLSESESESESEGRGREPEPPLVFEANKRGELAERISRDRELKRWDDERKRVEAEIENLTKRKNRAKEFGETWPEAERLRLVSMRERKTELLALLGMKV